MGKCMDSIKPKIEIEDVEFDDSKKVDKVNRKDAILHFEKILKNVAPPYVIAINGPWGTGKTVFLKMLKDKVKDEHRVLYHSAWEHDYSSDPLLSLLVSLKDEYNQVNKYIELMESAGRVVMTSLPHVASILTHGFVKPELAEGLINSVASEIGKEASKNKDAVSDFKNKLKSLVSSEPAGKKLIFIVDDLDRCKPTYAIEVLEKIKHLFNVERVVFIVGIDKEQLEHSIKAVYGDGYDSKRYLQRFFDLEYNLPQVVTDDYLNHVIKELGLYKFFEPRVIVSTDKKIVDHPTTQIRTVISTFNKLYSFDLRQVQRLLHRFALMALMARNQEDIEPIFMLSLLILYHYDKDTYDFILSDGEFDDEIIIKYKLLAEKTPSKRGTQLWGVIAGMTLARKISDRDEILSVLRDNEIPFSDATIESWYDSEVYIKRTENFINASNDFVS